jgi:chromatin remodeling complex protein RSC6
VCAIQLAHDCRIIQCDEALKTLLGVKSFQGFGLMKLLSRHILPD